jgi:hypothetical protein
MSLCFSRLIGNNCKGVKVAVSFLFNRMAGQSRKKIISQNANIITSHTIAYTSIILFYTLYRIIYHWDSFTLLHQFWFCSINLITYLLYKQMTGSGMDLNQEGGLLSFFYDILYVSWFTLISSCFSSAFYWTLILIPIFGLYKVTTTISAFFSPKA